MLMNEVLVRYDPHYDSDSMNDWGRKEALPRVRNEVISPENRPPVIVGNTYPLVVECGDIFYTDISGTYDPDGDQLSYSIGYTWHDYNYFELGSSSVNMKYPIHKMMLKMIYKKYFRINNKAINPINKNSQSKSP